DTSGTADRLGRAIPALIVGVPVLVAGAFVSTAVYGEPEVLPSLIGVSLGILFSGLGLSSIMSARFPYPVANPGDSPFTSQQSTATASSLIQSLSFMLTSVLAIPSLIFAALGFIYGGNWPWVSFACGILLGLAVLGIGIGVGGHVFRRRSTELLAFSMRN
ncbi:MAG: conserved rane protein putative transporter permease component, partial [Glaciihabitans sp.]|nr:conserved rane protein putative transporter permease component [Glaciihabitans sp.]